MRTMTQARWTRRIGTAVSATALVGAGLVGVAAPAQAALATASCADATKFDAGDGSTGNPYQVTDAQQLYNATVCGSGKFVKLMNDIDLASVTSSEWSTTTANYFEGQFDGNSKTVRNLTTVTTTTANTSGLFGYIGENARVHDLNLVNIDVTATAAQNSGNGGISAGALAAKLDGRIERVTLDATSTVTSTGGGPYSMTGGLVGSLSYTGASARGVIQDSTSAAIVEGTSQVGGLVGEIQYGDVDGGTFSGQVTATKYTGTPGQPAYIDDGDTRAGGIAGVLLDGAVSDASISNATVTGTGLYVGGAVGQTTTTSATLTNVTVSGAAKVTGTNFVGGLVGSFKGTITSSSFESTNTLGADVTGVEKVGGIAGLTADNASSIILATVSADISGTGLYVGGLVGNAGQGAITSSSSSGTVTGSNHTGGLVGSSGVAIDKSHSSSTVTASPTNSVYIGGLVGTQATAAITKSFATGDVTASAGNNVGGLVGNLNSGSVTDSYATGSVTGASVVGGLAGRMNAPITSSYSTGLVTGTADGGLIGTRSSGTVTFSYFDITVNPTATPDPLKGTGSTTTTMKTFSLYDSGAWSIYDGWESTPTKTWGICDASGYPFLRWYQTTDPNCPSAPAPSPSGGGGTTTPTVVTPVVVTPVAEVPPTTPTADPLGPQEIPTVTKLTPGGTEVTTGGAPTPVKTVPNKKKDTVTSSGDDWKVTTAGRTPAGTTTTLGPKNSVQIPQGGTVVVSGSGYQPGTMVQVYAMNPALLLGILTVGANGTFRGNVTWPAGLPAGASVLQMNGYSVNDVVRSYSLGINVTKVPAARVKTVTSTIYFAAGSSKLSPEAMRKLAKIASSVPKGAKATTIVSAGYVQPTPDKSNDFTLSTARATTVADQLKVNKLKGKYFITGRGVAKEKDARGRKVVVTITYTVR